MMPRKQRAIVLWGLIKLGLVLLVLTSCASSSEDDSDATGPFSRVTLQAAPIDQLSAKSLRRLVSPSQTRQGRSAPAVLQIDVTAGDISPITAKCPIPMSPIPGATSLCDAVGTSEATLLVMDVTETAVMVASTLLVPTNSTATINVNGVLTYTPDSGFVGNDRVTVSVTDDGTPALSDEVSIDLPVVDLSEQAFTFEDSAIFGVAGEATLSFC